MGNVLDQAVLEELLSYADDGDPELLLDLIQMFLDDSPSKVAAVEQALETGDFEKAERAAHSLKGSSGTLGARLVQDVCELLQVSTRNQRLEESQALAPRLVTEYEQADAALRAVLARYRD